jgi:hypothetical protein
VDPPAVSRLNRVGTLDRVIPTADVPSPQRAGDIGDMTAHAELILGVIRNTTTPLATDLGESNPRIPRLRSVPAELLDQSQDFLVQAH